MGRKRKDAKEQVKAEHTVEPAQAEYAFPTKSRCPRCGVTDTKAVSTQAGIQYRQCQRAICRKSYAVFGSLV